MATLQELESALRKADAAGNADDARVFASEIRKMQPQAAPQAPQASLGDMVAGHPATRLAMGAASPFIGAAQAGAGIGDWINEQTGVKPWLSPKIADALKSYEEAKQRGMQAAGNEGTDWMGLAGSLAPMGAVASGVTKALPQATGLMGRMGAGAASGAAVGAVTPVSEGDLGTEKAKQIAAGGTIGAAAPAMGDLLSKVGSMAKRAVAPFSESGRANVLSEYQNSLVGSPENQEKVIQALTQAKSAVPGVKLTSGEALAYTPEGTGIASHQRAVSKMEKGISPEFTKRFAENDAARKAALETRDAVTKPMRQEALDAANRGYVTTQPLLEQIQVMKNKPGDRASDVVTRTLGAVEDKLKALTNEYGTVDAKDLYTVRKELGNTIQGFSKETANWDKKLTSGLEKDIQHSIDEAIVKAGGENWPQYLEEFSSRSKAVSDDMARLLAYRKLAQQTNFSGAKAIHEGVQFPNLLSRPAMLANYAMKHIGIEPAHEKISKLAAAQYLDPEKLATSLRGQAPSRTQAIIDALMSRMPAAASTAASRYIGGE